MIAIAYCRCGHANGIDRQTCEWCWTPLPGAKPGAWEAEQLRVQAEIREQYRRVERRQNLEAALLALAIFVGAVIAGILWRS